MPLTPEEQARQNIDALLTAAGWIVQDRKDANPAAGRGVAIREFPLKAGFGEADYLLYVDGAAAGVIEAKLRRPSSPGLSNLRSVCGSDRESDSNLLPRDLPWPNSVDSGGVIQTACIGTIDSEWTNLLCAKAGMGMYSPCFQQGWLGFSANWDSSVKPGTAKVRGRCAELLPTAPPQQPARHLRYWRSICPHSAASDRRPAVQWSRPQRPNLTRI
jgi:hypothetical protein